MIRIELARKGVHLGGLIVPLAYQQMGSDFLYFFFPLAFLFFILELARLKIAVVGQFYLRIIGFVMRPGELHRPSGAFYFVLGAMLTIVIFPREVAVAALMVLVISDATAALVGQAFGRRKIFGKTLAGSLTFFGSAWLLLTLFLPGNPFHHLPAALLGTLAEAMPGPVNDNLSIPLVVGTVLWLML